MTMYAPAAKWAAAASVAPDVQCFIDTSDSKLPFVDDHEPCYDFLVQANVAVESPFDAHLSGKLKTTFTYHF